MSKKVMSGKLTEQQRYLLNRIPAVYQMDDKWYGKPKPETAELKRARRLIAAWDKAEALRVCKAKKRNEALITKARESVYFDPPEKALRIVQQCEKLLKGCPV
jgi:hypothetical protein